MTKKKVSIDWKALKPLFWLAPLLITAGLTAGIIGGQWGIVPIALLLSGLAIALLWVAVATRGGLWEQRSTQVGTNALISIAAVLVILGLVNFLGDRYSKRIDLTENQLFTLAPQTTQVLVGLEDPVKIWIFDISANPQDEQLLKNYQRKSSRFSYEYVDPQAQPLLTQQFGVEVPGEVYLETAGDRRFVQTVNIEERLSERSLTNALANSQGVEPPKVYFMQGHGEAPLEAGRGGFSEAVKLLEQENYVVEPLTQSADSTIPEDAAVLIVAGPRQELLETELAAIESYLEKRSGLMLMLDPTIESGFDDLLDQWGIGLGENTIIVDPSGQAVGSGPGVVLITQYGDHPITEKLSGISFYPIAQPIAVNPVEGVDSAPILVTGEQAQVQVVDETGNAQTEADPEQQGSLAVGVALDRQVDPAASSAADDAATSEANNEAENQTDQAEPSSEEESSDPEAETSPDAADLETEEAPVESTPEESDALEDPDSDATVEESSEEAVAEEKPEEPTEARLIVIGNSSFASDGLITQQLNSDVFLNAVNWLSQGNDDAIAIRPKEATNRRILLTNQQQIMLSVSSLLIVPLIGVAIAVLLWLRRR